MSRPKEHIGHFDNIRSLRFEHPYYGDIYIRERREGDGVYIVYIKIPDMGSRDTAASYARQMLGLDN